MTYQIPKSPNINWYLAIQFNSHVDYLKFTSDTTGLGAEFHKVTLHFKCQLHRYPDCPPISPGDYKFKDTCDPLPSGLIIL